MALIVEDGTGLADSQSYVSAEVCATYAAARGHEFSDDADGEAALLRATTWLDGSYRDRFPGKRTHGRTQALQWPRIDAADTEGSPIASDEIPQEVIDAACEAAIRELAEPGVLSPDYVPAERVTAETVGPISIRYADAKGDDAARPVATVIEDILSGLLTRKPVAAVFGPADRA